MFATFIHGGVLRVELAALAAAAIAWPTNVMAWQPQPKPPIKRSLDEELLEDLSVEPAKAPGPKAPSPEKDASQPAQPAKEPADGPAKDLDDDLLKGLDGGEDISLGGEKPADNPVARLNERMREVQRRMAREQSGEQTQRLEREIADELARLIEQVKRQARPSGKSKSSSSGAGRSQAKQPGAGAQPAEQAADQPARESSDRLRKEKTAKVDAEYQDLLKDFWGHLPPHLRQQMEQSANEEFLPKYELEISDYFRALNQRGGK